MRGLGSGHVTCGPMRGLKINFTQTDKSTNIATLSMNRKHQGTCCAGPIRKTKEGILFLAFGKNKIVIVDCSTSFENQQIPNIYGISVLTLKTFFNNESGKLYAFFK